MVAVDGNAGGITPAIGSLTLGRRYDGPIKFTEGRMAEEPRRPRLIVGISGASGVIYGARLLELLRPLAVETHLLISRAAEVRTALATDLKTEPVRSGAGGDPVNGDLAEPI